MTKTKNWLKLLKVNPTDLLIKKAPLPIKYATAQLLLPENTELISKIERELETYKPRVKLLKSQKSDGLWKLNENYSLEEKQKTMIFLLQLKNMTKLLSMGCTKQIPEVQRGLVALLKMQKHDGKFPLLQHHHSFALWLLVKYGLGGNPFVEKGFRWITRRQRKDGGWLSPTMLPSGVSYKIAKSCIWTTVIALQAFSIHTRLKNSPSAELAANFVLENYLKQNKVGLFTQPDAWNHLYINYTDNGLFRGGTLRFIEALAPLPYTHEHKNFRKAIEWLIDQQLPSGLFPSIAGRLGEGNYNVTFRVLSVLRKLEEMG